MRSKRERIIAGGYICTCNDVLLCLMCVGGFKERSKDLKFGSFICNLKSRDFQLELL